MNKTTVRMLQTLGSLGIDSLDALALRRISMTLHRWHEQECGDGSGAIERFPGTDKPMWRSAMTGKAHFIPDRELSAFKRLAKIMDRYPTLKAYIQHDPCGAALYILRPGDVPEGCDEDAYYSRGIAVYK